MKKFFSYLLTFVVLFVMAATGTIFLSMSNGDTGSVVVNVDVEGAQEASFFSGLLSTFEENKQFNVNGNIYVKHNDKQIPLYIYANVDISDKNNIKAEGFLKVKINNQNLSLTFNFYDENIFISFKEMNFKFSLNDITTIKNQIENIIGLFGIDQNLLSFDISDFNFDINSIMFALNNVVEEKLNNGYTKNIINIENLAVAELILDENGVIKSVNVNSEDIFGIKISANLNVNFNNEIIIANPEGEGTGMKYVNVMDILDFTSKLISVNNFKMNIDFAIAGDAINGSLKSYIHADVNAKEFGMKVYDTNFFGIDNSNIAYKDGNLYISYNDVYVMVSHDAISSLSETIRTLLLPNIPELISQVENKISEYNFDFGVIFEIINKIDKLSCTQDKFVLEIGENIFEVSTIDNILTHVTLNLNIFDTSVNLLIDFEECEDSVEIENQEKYVDVYSLYQKNKDFFATMQFDISIAADVQFCNQLISLSSGLLVDVNAKYLSANGSLNIGKDYDFGIIYDDNNAYLKLDNSFIKCDIERIKDVLKVYGIDVDKELNDNINDNLSDEITRQVDKYKNYSLNDIFDKLDSIKQIQLTSDGFVLTADLSKFDISVSGTLEIYFNNWLINQVKLSDVEYDGKYLGFITININDNKFEKTIVNENEYFDVMAVYDDIYSIMGLKEAVIYANSNIKYNENVFAIQSKISFNLDNQYYNVCGKFTFNDNINNFDLSYYDQTTFVKIQDVLVKAKRSNIEKLIGLIGNYINLGEFDSDSLMQSVNSLKLIETARNIFDDFGVDDLKIIRSCTVNANYIKLVINLKSFGFNSDFVIILNLKNNKVQDIEIINLQLDDDISVSFKIALFRNNVETVKVDEEQYTDVFGIVDDIIGLKDLRHASLTLNADVKYRGNAYGVNLAGAFNLDTNYYNLAGLVNYKGQDVDLGLSFYDDELYVKFQNIYVKASSENIEKILSLISNRVSIVEFDKTQIIEKIYSLKLISKLKSIIESLSEEDINALKEIALNSEELILTVDKNFLDTENDFELKIKFNNGKIEELKIDNLELDNDIKISFDIELDRNYVETVAVDEDKYLDVFGMIEDAIALKDLRHASLTLDADVEYRGNAYGANLAGAFDFDTDYYNLAGLVNYKGQDVNLSLSYYNEDAYIKINDIFVKVNKKNIEKIVSMLSDNVSLDSVDTDAIIENILSMKLINTVKDLVANFAEEDINLVKNIQIDSNTIKLTIDKDYISAVKDLQIIITLNNSTLSAIEIKDLELDDDVKGSIKVTLDRSEVEAVAVDEDKYLDVFDLVDNIIALENADIINANIKFDLFKLINNEYESDLGFTGVINKDHTEDTLLAFADFIIRYKENSFNLKGKLEDSDIFADLNGFKIRIDSDKVLYTLHKILSLANIDTEEYDDLITRILGVLGGQSVSQAFDGFDFGNGLDETIEKLKADIDVDLDNTINQVLTNIKIDSEKIVLSVDLTCIGIDIKLDVTIFISNGNLTYVNIEKLKIGDRYIDLTLELDQSQSKVEAMAEEDKVPYIDIKSLADLAELTYETVKNGSVSGQVEFDFKFNGNLNHVVANYGVKIANKQLTAFLTTTFNGLNINIYYVDGVFYLDLGGVSNSADNRLQIKATFEEHEALFAWIKDEFGFDVLEEIKNLLGMDEKLDLNHIRSVIRGETTLDFSLDEILNIIANFDLGFVKYANFTDGELHASLTFDLDIGAYYDDIVNRVTIGYGKDVDDSYQYYVDIAVVDFDDIVLDNLNACDYVSYKVITDAISAVMNTLSADPLEFFANVNFFENNKKANRYLKVGYQDDMFFVDFYGMKISIARNSLSQVLSMALEVLGMDPSLASIIGEVADTSELDTSNLQATLPAIDLGNPFTMLNYLKSITLKDGVFTILIDSALFNSTTGKDFEIKLSTANGKISKLEVNNIYTSGEKNDYINASITFNRGVANSTYSSYINLSNSVDLIKAFLNTSQLNDYLVQGKVMLSVSSIDAAKIDVDFRVKLDENKKPIIVVTLSNYPMIVEINDVNTNERGGTLLNKRYREITIYYKDGDLYLKTYDDDYRYLFVTYKSYERITRVTPGYLIDNIKYYLNWLLGFTSMIQNKIDEAIDVSMNYTGDDDLSDIILSYSKSGNSHYIKLNLQKIVHNDDIGELSITLTTTNNSSTGYKDYLYAMDIDLKMLDNLLSIKTDSSNKLYLKNIGQTVDVTSAQNFINSYAYNPYGEYAKEGSGSYSQTNKKTITITLNKDGGTGASSLSGNLGSNMTLPTPTKVVDNWVTKVTYSFLGWFDADGKKCTLTYFPAKNMTLTAHWEVATVQYYKTLTVKNNNGSADQTIKQLQYTNVNISTLSDYVVDDGITRKSYTFLGWSLGGVNIGKNVTVNLDDNKTIEGLWSEDVVYYRTATFDSNGGIAVSSNKQLEGTVITLPTITKTTYDDNIVRIEYTFVGWSDGTQVYVVGSDFTLTDDTQFTAVYDEYLRYYYDLTVNNNNGSADYIIRKIEGSQISIEALADYVVDDGITRKSYTFLGWSLGGVNIGKNVTVNLDDDKTIEGLWQEVVVYYRTATFNSNGAAAVSNNKQLEGTVITLPTIIKTTYDDGIVNIVYTFIGWSDGTQVYVGGSDYTFVNDVQFTAIFDEYVREYHTITVVNELLGINQSIKELNDHEKYVLPVHQTQIVEEGNVRYYFDFVGYKDQNNNIITEFNFDKDVVATANYEEDVERRVYISTLTVYNYDNSILLQETKTNGESVLLPTIPNVVEYDEYVGGREYHVVLNFLGFSQELTQMPNHDVDIYANYSEVSRKGYYTLNIYDINTSTGQINNSLVSTILLEGETVVYPTLTTTDYNLTISGETGHFVFNGWDTSISVMPAQDVTVRATYLTYYTLTFYDINSSNGQITRQLSSTQVLVGSAITYPTITTTSYRINNSDGSYKMYTYTGWNNSATTMPNKNLTISANYSVTTYYKVQFNVSWYRPSWWLNDGTITTSPTAPATQYIAAGTKFNTSSYSASIKVTYKFIFSKSYSYSTKGWSTSPANNSSSTVGQITINSNVTLYAVWNH